MSQMPLRGDGWFAGPYGFLCNLYPIHKRSDAECIDYEKALRSLPEAAVRRAIADAPRYWEKFFPSAGELFKRALEIDKKDRGEKAKRPEAEPTQPHKLADDNPYEQLARKWEEESRRLGIHPHERTPQNVAQGRVAELRGVVDDNPIGQAGPMTSDAGAGR